MKVISAANYTSRTVVRVCLNPDAPEWLHVIGDVEKDIAGDPVLGPDGVPIIIQRVTPPPGHNGQTCHNCRYNWVVRELVFDGAEYASKSADELWELVCLACRPGLVPEVITDLIGRSD